MLITRYDLDVFTPPCEPGAERVSAIARLETDISEVLPYLNATLRGAMYNPAAKALTWRKGGRTITFSQYQIAVSNLEDRTEAENSIADLMDLVNKTWARRDEITPDETPYQRPTPLQVYGLLPQTNCRACGQPTCFTFALKLIAQQTTLDQCPVLFDPDFAERRNALEAILPT